MFSIQNFSSIEVIIRQTFLAFSAIIVFTIAVEIAFYVAKKIIIMFRKLIK